MSKFKVLGICGSLRKDSLNQKLLYSLSKKLPVNIKFEQSDLLNIPLYNEDLEEDLPSSVKELAEQVLSSDVVIICTPEYNSSIPGVLKNTLDWLSRSKVNTPFANKLVAVMGTTSGMLGTIKAQLHLREVLFALNAEIIRRPEVLIGNAHTKFSETGELIDERANLILDSLVIKIMDEIEKNSSSNYMFN